MATKPGHLKGKTSTEKVSNSVWVSTHVDAKLLEWLRLEASKRDRSQTWMFNEAIRQMFRRVETRRLKAAERDGKRRGLH